MDASFEVKGFAREHVNDGCKVADEAVALSVQVLLAFATVILCFITIWLDGSYWAHMALSEHCSV